MDSLIKETNDNLRAIIDTMKETRDNSISVLDNIQIQMDKKVEEAKKYKIQVDAAKEKIKELEADNKSLELSLNELSDKYGKMNLVSIVEAGNREIKTKINDNLKEINKQKEQIAELTNKARTIKDLLINLKKDRTVKEERLENIKVVYNYYSERINEIVDYAFDHSENLSDYKNSVSFVSYEEEDNSEDVKTVELENTMVFDEIANIDDNKNFKDEMTFINSQIDDEITNEQSNIDDIIKRSLEKFNVDKKEDEVEETYVDEPNDTTQVFDAILDSNLEDVINEEEITEEETEIDIELSEEEKIEDDSSLEENNEVEAIFDENEINVDTNILEDNNDEVVSNLVEDNKDNDEEFNKLDINADILKNVNNDDDVDSNLEVEEDKYLDEENENRINKINDLFSSFENTSNIIPLESPVEIKGLEEQVDEAYMDVFGQPINSADLNKKDPTLTDIFGNPVSKDELSEDVKTRKKLEELFIENGIDFNKFREDEKNYLKEIYDEEKFNNILNTLKRNKINLDNVYNAFNIFGEISANELENLINKLVNVGQSVEAIGIILEKLPKVKKYNLDEAIMNYGDYIKDVDITELVMKAKELYNNGGNN